MSLDFSSESITVADDDGLNLDDVKKVNNGGSDSTLIQLKQ